MTKQIFMDITSRSGTTIWRRVLSYHWDIFIYPVETGLNLNFSPFRYTSVLAKQWKNERYFTYWRYSFQFVFIKKLKIVEKHLSRYSEVHRHV